MKPKPNVRVSRHLVGKLKRLDIIGHNEMWLIVYQGQPITIAVVDENIEHFATPRYRNTVYSQKQSALNAVAKLNREFNTTAFEVKLVKL